MKVALAHDWMTGMRGGEKVLLAFTELFPDADIFTLVYNPEAMDPRFRKHRVATTLLQRIPLGRNRYQYFLPFYWELMGRFDLSSYDLIVSTSTACGKWVRNPGRKTHICYCNTPMRYIWDLFDDYFGETSPAPVRWAAKLCRAYLQRCDLKSNDGVTRFLASSTEVQRRIKRIYGRDSEIIPPPVDVVSFRPKTGQGNYFLVVSALVPYKRVDLAVRVCTRRHWPLVIVGKGGEEAKLRAMAGPTIAFKGWVPDEDLPSCYAGAKALLFPGKEDFGIAPVEALAAGIPVVAFGEGGVQDTLRDGETGTLFYRQTEEDLEAAVARLETLSFDPEILRRKAMPFSRANFLSRMREYFRGILESPRSPV